MPLMKEDEWPRNLKGHGREDICALLKFIFSSFLQCYWGIVSPAKAKAMLHLHGIALSSTEMWLAIKRYEKQQPGYR